MKHIARFVRFWYDFIVGDDWTIAVGVVVAVGSTAIVHRLGLPAWPVLPLVVVVGLFLSVYRVRRSQSVPSEVGSGSKGSGG
jgi:hypothetical protein